MMDVNLESIIPRKMEERKKEKKGARECGEEEESRVLD